MGRFGKGWQGLLARRIFYSNAMHFGGGNRDMGSPVWAQDGMVDRHQKAYSQD